MDVVETGRVYELKSAMVKEEAINVLRAMIEARPEVFFFDCKLCGAERPSNAIDPGVLMFRPYVCADINARCKSPPTPRTTKRVTTYRPGSLVMAPIDQSSERLWPGIIEDCPEGTESYCVAGKSKSTVSAYFVTFIFPNEPSRRWWGGFIASRKLVPLEQFITDRSRHIFEDEYYKALDRARKSVSLSLRDRLLKFSFVAHVASSRDIPIGPPGSSSLWSRFFGKRKSVEAAMPTPGSPPRERQSAPSSQAKLAKIDEDGEGFEKEQPTTSSGASVRPRTRFPSSRSAKSWTHATKPDGSERSD